MSCIYMKDKWYDDDYYESICTHCDSEFYGVYPYCCDTCALYEESDDELSGKEI